MKLDFYDDNKDWDKSKDEFNNLICNINYTLSLLHDDKICISDIGKQIAIYHTFLTYLENKINNSFKEWQNKYNKKYNSLNYLEYKQFDNYFRIYSKSYMLDIDEIYNNNIMLLVKEYIIIKKKHLYFKNQSKLARNKLILLELIY